MKGKKAPIAVVVDDKKFHSINAAADFMNITGCNLKRQLEKRIEEYRGYKIGYYKE